MPSISDRHSEAGILLSAQVSSACSIWDEHDGLVSEPEYSTNPPEGSRRGPVEAGEDDDENAGYVIHKLGRQVASQGVMLASGSLMMAGNYRIQAASFADPAFKDVYRGSLAIPYDSRSFVGKALQWMFLPGRYREQPLSTESQERLRSSGASLLNLSCSLRQVSNAVQLASDIGALASCGASGCAPEEVGAVSLDTVSTSFSIGTLYYLGRGAALMNQQQESAAFLSLNRAMGFFGKGSGAFRALTGVARLSIELNRYAKTGDANGSAAAYGALDAMTGTGQVVYINAMMHQVAKAATVAQKNSIMSANIMTLSPLLTSALRCIGVFGAGLGLMTNAYIMHDALTNEGADPQIRKKNLRSSSMGIAGSLLLAASALFIAPPLAPIAGVLSLAGMAILVGQSIYDHYDSLASSHG